MATRRPILVILAVAVFFPACAVHGTLGRTDPEPKAPPSRLVAAPQAPAPASVVMLAATAPLPQVQAQLEEESEGEVEELEEAEEAEKGEEAEVPPHLPPPTAKEGPPVVSPRPEAPAEARPVGVPAALPGKPQFVSLNFENADLELVLRSIADITGINFVLAPGIKAQVTMRTTTKVPASEVFSMLEAILEVNNLVAIKDGPIYKIVPIAVAEQELQEIQVGKEPSEEKVRGQYITQIVRLDHLSAEEMAKILQSFLGRGSKLVVHKETNSLIIGGIASTVRRLLETIKALDTPTKRDNVQRIFVYFVENAKATELATVLNTLYGRREAIARPPTPGARPGAPPGRPGAPPPPPAPGQLPIPPSQPPTGAALPPGTEAAPGEVVGEVTIVSDEATNALVIKTSPRNYEFIEGTIKQLDIVPKQVIIEALLAEVTLTDSLQFSLEAFVKTGSFVFQQAVPGGPALSALNAIAGGQLVGGAQGFTFTFVQGDKFRTFLNNVAAYTKVNILAAPHLLTANNKEAKLQIGSEVPIITNEQASLTSVTAAPTKGGEVTPSGVFRSVQQKDIGIIMGIKPHINEKRLVTLDIETEQTDILSESFGSTGSPAFSKRASKTSIVIEDGQSLVLGGIIQNRVEKTHTGIPFLSRIPLLGYLFRNTKDSVTKTELLILVTPHVIASPEEGRTLTEQFEKRIESVEPLLKSLPTTSPSGLRDN